MDEWDNLSHGQKQTSSDKNKPPAICCYYYQGLVVANLAAKEIIIETHFVLLSGFWAVVYRSWQKMLYREGSQTSLVWAVECRLMWVASSELFRQKKNITFWCHLLELVGWCCARRWTLKRLDDPNARCLQENNPGLRNKLKARRQKQLLVSTIATRDSNLSTPLSSEGSGETWRDKIGGGGGGEMKLCGD